MHGRGEYLSLENLSACSLFTRCSCAGCIKTEGGNYAVYHQRSVSVSAGGLVILYVLGHSLFLVKAWKRAAELGIPKKCCARSAAARCSTQHRHRHLLGLLSLSASWAFLPWLRLSVLGALTYELPAAASVAKILGMPMDQPVSDPAVYTAIAWVMTLGILSGILIILFFQKRMQSRLQRMKEKDSRWSAILMDSLFVGMIATFLGMVFADVHTGLVGFIPVFVMLFSALVMALCGIAIKKLRWKWLENYAMPISMLSAMAFAIPLTAWIGGKL